MIRKNMQKESIVTKIRWLETYAHLIGRKHDLSEMKEENLKEGEIAIDQTYREALGFDIGEKIEIRKTKQRYGFKEKLLSRLNYQKAVVRVQPNAPFMENKTPVACICEDMVSSIGAEYGDIIMIEVKDRKISVKCAKLSSFMSEFHDAIIGHQLTKTKMNELNKEYEDTWIKSPFNLITKWGKISKPYGELIHPVFMDQISRKILKVKPLDTVKIRKSLSWETQKKFNSFGGLAILAIAILIPELVAITFNVEELKWSEELKWLWLILIPLMAFIIWSVLTSSKYRTNIE